MKLSMIKTSTALAAVLAIFTTSLPFADANAAGIRAECEKRANRSKISADGTNLVARNYTAKIISGSNTKKSASKSTTGDEVEFDFDNDPGDIAAGATRIAAISFTEQLRDNSSTKMDSLLLNPPEPAVRDRS